MEGESMRKKLASLTDDKAPVHNADTSGTVPRPSGPHHRIRCPSSNGMHAPFPWNPHPKTPARASLVRRRGKY
ncbi:hypothetical protein DFAR_280001 [Desulfarculales bacterium]